MSIEDDDTDSDIGNTAIHGHASAHTGVPSGATLDIGIPCITSSKRKRFKAYVRYISEVEGDINPWVGVEIPLPIDCGGDPWGDRGAGSGGTSTRIAGGQTTIGSGVMGAGYGALRSAVGTTMAGGRPREQEAEGGRGKRG